MGMTSREVEIYKLKQKGLTDEFLAGQNALGKNGEGVDIIGKVAEVAAGKIDEEIKKLQQEVDVLGMTAGAKKAFEAATKGATDAQKDSIEQLSREIDYKKYILSLQEEIDSSGLSGGEKKLLKIATDGATDAELRYAAALEHTAEISKQAEQLNKEFADPIDAYAKSVSDLTDMLNAGLITQAVYDKGIDKAAMAYDKAASGAKDAAAAVGTLNAALSGSAEATSRIQDYTSKLKMQMDVTSNRPNVGEQQNANNRDVLMKIRDILQNQADRGVVQVQVGGGLK
jgi:hypothetical protein